MQPASSPALASAHGLTLRTAAALSPLRTRGIQVSETASNACLILGAFLDACLFVVSHADRPP